MSTLESNAGPVDLNDPAVVGLVLRNPEVRQLVPGSDEFSTAVRKLTETQATPVVTTETERSSPDETVTPEAQEVEEETEAGDEPVKSGKGFKRRITQLAKARDEAKAEAVRLQAELAALKNPPTAQAAAQAQVSYTFETPKPQLHEFKDLGEFTEALTDWKDAKRSHERELVRQADQVRKAVEETAKTWETREAKVKAELEDYEAVVNVDGLETVNLTKTSHDQARAFLTDSDHGPEVLYRLLSDDELSAKFKAATPVQQVKVLTKLEAQVEAERKESPSNSTTTTTGRTAPPAPPPNLASRTGVKVSSVKLSEVAERGDFTEFARLRAAQIKARGKT
jgi:hypothetical protein